MIGLADGYGIKVEAVTKTGKTPVIFTKAQRWRDISKNVTLSKQRHWTHGNIKGVSDGL